MIDSILNTEILQVNDGIYHPKGEFYVHGAFQEGVHDELFALEDKSWWFVQRNKIIHAVMEKYPPLGNVLVDVGGGNGVVSSYLEARGIETILFEPGIKGIINSKRRGLKHLVCAPLGNKTVNPESVPAIGLFDVLEHMEKESDFLQDVYNALMNDGMLYVTVPAHNILWSDEDEMAGHFRRYNLKDLTRVLEANGFSVLFGTYFFRMLSPAIFAFRVLPYRLGIKKKQSGGSVGFVAPSVIEKIVQTYFDREARKIRNGNTLRHGASVFVVAKKENHP